MTGGARSALKRGGARLAGQINRRRSSRRAVALCYHSIHPTLDYASASPGLFDEQLAWLQANCEVMLIDELPKAAGHRDSSRPAVAITFDDGYADNHEYALPLLAKYRLPATVYATTGLCAREPEVVARFASLRSVDREEVQGLSWTQISELHGEGVQIGAHTHSHPNLMRLGRAEAEAELRRSRDILQDRIEVPVEVMAYPFGKPRRHFDEATMSAAASSGYRHAASITFLPVTPATPSLATPRFFCTKDSVETLAAKVRGDWDYLGYWQKHAPRAIARLVSPQDFRF